MNVTNLERSYKTHAENVIVIALNKNISLNRLTIFNVTFTIFEMTETIYFGINLKETVTDVSKCFLKGVT